LGFPTRRLAPLSSNFSGAVAGEKEDFCKESLTLPIFYFVIVLLIFFTLFLLAYFYQRYKKISSFYWLKDFPKKEVLQIRVGVCAIIWAMWNVRNNFIFNKPRTPTFLQVIPLAIYWIRMWSYLQQVEDRPDMDSGCNRWEMVAQGIYSQCGWRLAHRITI
jgi:hypothetical protein